MKKASAFKRCVATGAAVVVSMLAASAAQAATIVCPQALPGNNNPRQYQTTGASDCVWGNGNIGNGGGNDQFLSGTGTNEAAYGNTGAQFGLSWTLIDKVDAIGGIQGSLNGLAVSNSDNNTFNWTLTDLDYGQYALGLTDGGDPKWAVFLLSATTGIADILSQGSWSHVALYGTGSPPPPPPPPQCGGPGQPPCLIPEPGSLALVSLALLSLGTGLIRRRQRG